MFRLPKLTDLKHLSHLNNIKNLVIIFLVLLTIYLLVKSPKIESSFKVELDKTIESTEIQSDTLLIE